MTERSKVAVVRGETRRDGVRAALELLGPELRARIQGRVIVKPNLGCGIVPRQKAATHIDALRGVLDIVTAQSPTSVTIAEGGEFAAVKYESFGYATLEREYDVRFVDLNAETRWESIKLQGLKRKQLVAGVSRTVLEADCVVSLAMPKTHDLVVVSISIKNMMGCLLRHECKHMHGVTSSPWWYSAVPARARQTIARSMPKFSRGLRRSISRLQQVSSDFTGSACDPRLQYRAGDRPREMVTELSRILSANLATLTAHVKPHISVVDGFCGLEGEGPTQGDPVDFGIAAAGLDAVAVDATIARLMGFDPQWIEYLSLAADRGLGVVREEQIDVIGASSIDCERSFRPHPDFAGQFDWRASKQSAQ
jgi:uncharacterized protein (DUF362 family)